MVNLIKAKTTDCSLLSELANTIWHECYKDMLSYEQRVYMLDKFSNPKSICTQIENGMIFYIVYFNNEPSGYFAYTKHIDHIYLEKLYIKQNVRGNGIFTLILNYLDTYKQDIKLNTCKYNPTLKIYQHVGFEIYSEDKHDIGMGFYMDDYNLIKKYKK